MSRDSVLLSYHLLACLFLERWKQRGRGLDENSITQDASWLCLLFDFVFCFDGLQPTLTTPRSDFALVLFVLLLRIGLLVMYFVVCVKICRG